MTRAMARGELRFGVEAHMNIGEVARRAGVSRGTGSYPLSGPAGLLSTDTRAGLVAPA